MEGNSTVASNGGLAKESSELISNSIPADVAAPVSGVAEGIGVGAETTTPATEEVLTAGVSTGGDAAGGGNGAVITAKLKQVKTKVTERPGKDGAPSSWLVGVGSAQVKVYCTPHGTRQLYTISFWVDGKRVRQVFPTVGKAIAEAKEAGKRLNTGEVSVARFSSADWAAFERARELLGPTGVALETAAAEYASAFSKLRGRASLDAVVEFYLKRHPIDMQVKRVAEVVTECLEAKRQDRLSARYVRQFGYDLDQFAKRFKGYIGEISGAVIDAWLRSLEVSPRTRNNLRTSVGTLFSFAKAKRYVEKDHDELDAVGLAKESEGEIGIFRPAELQAMLAVARPELMPFLVLSAFAGIRHAEIQRLDWQDIRMKAGIIEIRAAKAKTASRRTVPIVPTLKRWLKVLENDHEASGPVCEFGNLTEQFEILVDAVNKARGPGGRPPGARPPGGRRPGERPARAGGRSSVASDQVGPGAFKWQHNGLRHSFISYRVATVSNVAQVALEAGNSPAIIFRNYRELVTPQDAKAWFAVTADSIKALREKAEKERRAKIVAHPALVAA